MDMKDVVAENRDAFYDWAYDFFGGEFEQDPWDGSWNEVGLVTWDEVVKGVDEWLEAN